VKLKRLRIEQLRQFRQPLEIKDFEPGINLFTGDNEAGKSSIVRAIRAAFFERYRSTSVDDLRPRGDSAAAPTVELEFDLGDIAYRLSKSFLQRKRCELRVGAKVIEGVEAEDHLAELFGFQFAGKGASKAEHWGIPGLLWIEQGTAHEVHGAVTNATDHLRTALNESLGEVTASGGDEVLAKVRAERDALLTGGGAPRAAYQEIIKRRAQLTQSLADLDTQIATYRQQVDSLSALRQQHAADEQERPWLRYRAEQAEAEASLAAIGQLELRLADDRAKLKQCDSTQALLRQQIDSFNGQQKEMTDREVALTAAGERQEEAQRLERQLSQQVKAIDIRYQQAHEALRLARQEDNRTKLQSQVREAGARTASAAETVAKAEEEQIKLTGLRTRAAATEIKTEDLAELRSKYAHLRELEIRQTAAATRVSYALEPGKTLILGDQALTGHGEHLLVAAAELRIAGIGRLNIVPGGTDLAELAREHAEGLAEHQALLQRLGLESLDQAETRYQTHRKQLNDISLVENTLAILAPTGLDALRSGHSVENARMAESQAALDLLPAPPAEPVPGLQVAEYEQEDARRALEAVNAQQKSAQQALTVAQTERESAQRERDALHAALQDPTRQQRVQQANQALVDAGAEKATLEGRIEQQSGQINAARPDILKQDIERLRRSAEQAEKQFRDRRDEIIRLETALQAAEAQGLEEQRATLAGETGQVERRHAELQRRAIALDYLLTRLEAKRSDLTRRLQAPLQKHLNRYLQLLFPQATLEIDAQLRPGPLTRPRADGPEKEEFDSLSFGAREQMGVISRLAYADLLQEAGRPTLIILDDALVHSDEQRLAQMKRVLFDAAQRHQILIFTCHPAGWRDIGVAARSIESLMAATIVSTKVA